MSEFITRFRDNSGMRSVDIFRANDFEVGSVRTGVGDDDQKAVECLINTLKGVVNEGLEAQRMIDELNSCAQRTVYVIAWDSQKSCGFEYVDTRDEATPVLNKAISEFAEDPTAVVVMFEHTTTEECVGIAREIQAHLHEFIHWALIDECQYVRGKQNSFDYRVIGGAA